MLSAKEAAELLCVHVETIRRMARRGDIPTCKVGKLWRIPKDALLDWAETHHLPRSAPRIIVVDDDQVVRDSLGLLLGNRGYRTSAAPDGAAALALMRGEPPDLVLLDLEMPGMSGPAVLQAIRSAHGAVPVVILTGYPDGELMTEAVRYGPLLVLAKPADAEQVVEAVRLALNGSLSAGRQL